MACASCGEQVDRLRSANNARLTFRLRRLLSRRPLSSESGSVSFGHNRCRHLRAVYSNLLKTGRFACDHTR